MELSSRLLWHLPRLGQVPVLRQRFIAASAPQSLFTGGKCVYLTVSPVRCEKLVRRRVRDDAWSELASQPSGIREPQQQLQSASPKMGSEPAPNVRVASHENIYTIPNILTLTRLAVAPVIGYMVLHDAHSWAVGLLAYAGVTDLLDGWIARRWNCRTVVGTVIDPMADKVLMTILTICLAIKGALPVWVASIILGRDVGLAVSAVYYRWISLPPPKTFTRYWDFSLPSAEVRPTTISKYNTFLQLALVGLTTAAPIIGVDIAPTLTVMQYVVAGTTIWSGASYIYSKDAVKIINQYKS